MAKSYDIDNNTSLYKRLYVDFNLYGANINNKEIKEMEEKNKYGKIN